ncbi:MAG: hypothetical protein K6F57_01205 [Candidatus Saccharibacteria bacterium]|nr:hypothetical protein [Candidatus Saccharibacteria bacterium]
MSENYPLDIAIAWTSDLDSYEEELKEAIWNCAKQFNNCNFRVLGDNVHLINNLTANEILSHTVSMNQYYGWIINSEIYVSMVSGIIEGGRYDNIIVLTRQRITHKSDDNFFEFSSKRGNLISLVDYRTGDDVQKVATLALNHVMGHMFIGDRYHHCKCDRCAMTRTLSHDRVKELAEFSGFCDECKEVIRASEYWSDEPSTVNIEF